MQRRSPTRRYRAGVQPGAPDPDQLTAIAAEVLRLLGNSTRLRIVRLLADGESSVGEIAERLAVPLPTASQHLAKLRAADVVRDRRVGTTVFYSMSDNHVTELVQQAVWYAGHMVTDEEHRRTAARRGWQ